jgi:hypothetical protein
MMQTQIKQPMDKIPLCVRLAFRNEPIYFFPEFLVRCQVLHQVQR